MNSVFTDLQQAKYTVTDPTLVFNSPIGDIESLQILQDILGFDHVEIGGRSTTRSRTRLHLLPTIALG